MNASVGLYKHLDEMIPWNDRLQVLEVVGVIDEAPDVAHEWRMTTREAFTWYLRRGYRVTGFSTAPDSGRCFYTVRASET